MRKMISFKLENLPEKQRQIIDNWADGQVNIQQSLANLIMHVVSFTGNDDVMDFDIQRKLHLIFTDADGNKEKQLAKKIEPVQVVQKVVKPDPETNETEEDVFVSAKDFYERDNKE